MFIIHKIVMFVFMFMYGMVKIMWYYFLINGVMVIGL